MFQLGSACVVADRVIPHAQPLTVVRCEGFGSGTERTKYYFAGRVVAMPEYIVFNSCSQSYVLLDPHP